MSRELGRSNTGQASQRSHRGNWGSPYLAGYIAQSPGWDQSLISGSFPISLAATQGFVILCFQLPCTIGRDLPLACKVESASPAVDCFVNLPTECWGTCP
jgi:hypothetical protein